MVLIALEQTLGGRYNLSSFKFRWLLGAAMPIGDSSPQPAANLHDLSLSDHLLMLFLILSIGFGWLLWRIMLVTVF